MEPIRGLLPKDGEADFFPQLFTVEESDVYFNDLQHKISWKQEPITIYGRTVMQPRLTAWYGDRDKVYSYSGITMQPHFWTPTLLKIKQRIETVSPVIFNSALLNLYRDQHDSMGWHRDNEKELGINPVIGSVSFGATRTFQFRYYTDKSLKRSLELTHGSFLLMHGTTQHAWEHGLPKRAGAKGVRINITFRVVN
jgi:alkylated DNA repair dioxygenase AlkB